MLKSMFVLAALLFSVSTTFAAGTSANAEAYINQLTSSPEFADLQGQSCMSQEGVRELLRAQWSDMTMGCRAEGERCRENSECCNNHCVGIRCNDNAGH